MEISILVNCEMILFFLQLYQKDKEIRAKLESNREKEMERERQLAQGVKAREPKVPSIYYVITFRGRGGGVIKL